MEAMTWFALMFISPISGWAEAVFEMREDNRCLFCCQEREKQGDYKSLWKI